MNIEDYIDEEIEELRKMGISITKDRAKEIKQIFLGCNLKYSAMSYEEQVKILDDYVEKGLREIRDREQAKQEYGTDYNSPYHLVEVDSKSSEKNLLYPLVQFQIRRYIYIVVYQCFFSRTDRLYLSFKT